MQSFVHLAFLLPGGGEKIDGSRVRQEARRARARKRVPYTRKSKKSKMKGEPTERQKIILTEKKKKKGEAMKRSKSRLGSSATGDLPSP